jgi:hypothetical protein
MYFVEENFLYEDRCTHPRKPLASSSILPLDRQGLSAATSRYHQCRLEAVVSETRLTHHLGSVIVDRYESASTSCYNQRRLGHNITNKTRQCHRQYNMAMTSRHGQRRFDGAITRMTQWRHHVMTNIASATPSPA